MTIVGGRSGSVSVPFCFPSHPESCDDVSKMPISWSVSLYSLLRMVLGGSVLWHRPAGDRAQPTSAIQCTEPVFPIAVNTGSIGASADWQRRPDRGCWTIVHGKPLGFPRRFNPQPPARAAAAPRSENYQRCFVCHFQLSWRSQARRGITAGSPRCRISVVARTRSPRRQLANHLR